MKTQSFLENALGSVKEAIHQRMKPVAAGLDYQVGLMVAPEIQPLHTATTVLLKSRGFTVNDYFGVYYVGWMTLFSAVIVPLLLYMSYVKNWEWTTQGGQVYLAMAAWVVWGCHFFANLVIGELKGSLRTHIILFLASTALILLSFPNSMPGLVRSIQRYFGF